MRFIDISSSFYALVRFRNFLCISSNTLHDDYRHFIHYGGRNSYLQLRRRDNDGRRLVSSSLFAEWHLGWKGSSLQWQVNHSSVAILNAIPHNAVAIDRCGHPPEYPNASWHMPPYSQGRWVRYKCFPGFYMSLGSAEKLCQEITKTWDNSKIVCTGRYTRTHCFSSRF